MSEIPADLSYTEEHEWVQRTGDTTVRVGITDYAQSALGDVVFVQLPDVGAEVTAGESFGEVESTKSVSDLYAPVSAKVVAVNGDLEANPQLVNSDPYGVVAGALHPLVFLGVVQVGWDFAHGAPHSSLRAHALI